MRVPIGLALFRLGVVQRDAAPPQLLDRDERLVDVRVARDEVRP